MKNNTKLMLICLMAVFSLAGCKKGEEEKTTAQKILGKWNIAMKESTETINGLAEKDTDTGKPGEYLDFRTNNTVYLKEDGSTEEGAGYTIDSDKQITFIYDGTDKTTFTINVLTDNKLVLYSKETITNSGLRANASATSDTAPKNTLETIITLTR